MLPQSEVQSQEKWGDGAVGGGRRAGPAHRAWERSAPFGGWDVPRQPPVSWPVTPHPSA